MPLLLGYRRRHGNHFAPHKLIGVVIMAFPKYEVDMITQ